MTDTTLMLSTADYATHAGVSVRTIKRWLQDDEIPGADKVGGLWQIPATAVRQERLSAVADLVTDTTRPAVGTGVSQQGHGPTLAALLEQQPAYLDLDTAARLMGIPAAAIRRHRDRYDAEPVGYNGALMIPQATIRRVAGL